MSSETIMLSVPYLTVPQIQHLEDQYSSLQGGKSQAWEVRGALPLPILFSQPAFSLHHEKQGGAVQVESRRRQHPPIPVLLTAGHTHEP